MKHVDDLPSEEQLARAMAHLDGHLYSGDEWGLVSLEGADLGLPDSLSSFEVEAWAYAGELRELARDTGNDTEPVVWFTFDLDLHVWVDIATDDVDPAWDAPSNFGARTVVGLDIEMQGRAGLIFEDSEDLGHLEYIQVSRKRGRTIRPLTHKDTAPSPGCADGKLLPFRKKGS